jgi:hypothetical protein
VIQTFQLLRNLGQFDSVDTGRNLLLSKIALVYAENGRRKTTLAAVLRSLGTGDPTPIVERQRLGSAAASHRHQRQRERFSAISEWRLAAPPWQSPRIRRQLRSGKHLVRH